MLPSEASESPSLAELLTRVRCVHVRSSLPYPLPLTRFSSRVKLASAYEAQCTRHWKTRAQKAGIGEFLCSIPVAWFKLAPDKFWSFFLHGEKVPRYPELAPVQVSIHK